MNKKKIDNTQCILNILKKNSEDILTIREIHELMKDEYNVEINYFNIRTSIDILNEDYNYKIYIFLENGIREYNKNDLESNYTIGEIKVIIDSQSYSNAIEY